MQNPPGIAFVFFAAALGLFAFAVYERSGPQATASLVAVDQPEVIGRQGKPMRLAEKKPLVEPDYSFYFNALDPGFELAQSQDTRFDPSDDYWGLPRKEGYELVSANCGACHSLAIVMQQRATPVQWSELLAWMVDKQGMAPMDPQDAQTVHTYLSANFSSR